MNDFLSSNLIFVISQPRSGSTLLQRMLSRHPAVHTTAEPWLMLHPLFVFKESGISTNYNHSLSRTAVADFLSSLNASKEYYFDAVCKMYLPMYQQACESAGKQYFLDKTPRYYFIIPELVSTFPDAKYIILVRNPLAVLNSVLETRVEGHWKLLYRYYDDLVTAPARLMAAKMILGDNLCILRYEDLVSHPGDELNKICDYLGFDYFSNMVDYGVQDRPEGRMGDEVTIEKESRPTTDRLNLWAQLGRLEQTRHFSLEYLNELGEDLIHDMGYDKQELISKLDTQPAGRESVHMEWGDIMHPDQMTKDRQVYVELALLEHRKIVHWIKKNVLKK